MDGEKKEALWESQQRVTSPPSTVNPQQVLAVAVTPEGWRQPSASAQEPSAPQVASCSSAGSWAQPFTLCHGPHASPRWGVQPCHAQEHNTPSVHQLPQLINCDARCEKAEPDPAEVSWGCRGVKEQTKKQQHSSAQCLLSPPGALWMPQCLCPPCTAPLAACSQGSARAHRLCSAPGEAEKPQAERAASASSEQGRAWPVRGGKTQQQEICLGLPSALPAHLSFSWTKK